MKREDRLHVRVGSELLTWLKRSAAKKHTTVSEVARQVLYAQYDARHSK